MPRRNERLIRAYGNLDHSRRLTRREERDLLKEYLDPIDTDDAELSQVKAAARVWNERCETQGNLDFYRVSFKEEVHRPDGTTEYLDFYKEVRFLNDQERARVVDDRTTLIDRNAQKRQKFIDHFNGTSGREWQMYLIFPLDESRGA